MLIAADRTLLGHYRNGTLASVVGSTAFALMAAAAVADARWRSRWESVPMADVERLQAVLAGFNAHDLDRVMSFFTDDCVLETPRGPDPWGTRCVGREAVRRALGERFSGIPDVHYGDDEHWVCGQHAVSKWRLTGTSASGEPIDVRGCDLFDLDPAGLIRHKDSYWKIVT